MSTLQIVAITGSLRKASFNTALLNTVKERAPPTLAISIETIAGIPIYNGDDETAHGSPPAVQALSAKLRAANAVIISTPEYNFSTPGPLKNAIDWISRPKDQPFKHKPVGIMGASNGPVGTARSQYHLRQSLQAIEAITMPRPEVLLTNASTKFDEARKLTDQATLDAVDRWLTAFEAWVRRF